MTKIALIRVISCNNKNDLNIHGRIIEDKSEKLSVDSYSIADQPRGIFDDQSMEKAVPKIIDLAKTLSFDYEGIIVSCAADPGVGELEKLLDIPVIGAGISLKTLVNKYGDDAGIIGIGESIPENYDSILSGKKIHYMRPEGIRCTVDIKSNRESVIKAAKELEKKGCDFITFACTGYSAEGAAEYLKDYLNIPVLDIIQSQGILIKDLIHKNRRV